MIFNKVILFLFLVNTTFAGWDYYYWTQEDVDKYIPNHQHKVGRVWSQTWNGEGNPDTSNWPEGLRRPTVISGKIGSAHRWPFDWKGKSIEIQWTDNLMGTWETLGKVKCSTGCAPVYFNIRIPDSVADRIDNSSAAFFRTMSTIDRPTIHWLKINDKKILDISQKILYRPYRRGDNK